MRSECLPFSEVPDTSRLFIDYLSYSPAIQRFYPRSPRWSQWLRDETPNRRYEASRRERVADALERQNRHWGASSATLQNLARFRAGACAAVTGQQVGLFGGPLFSLFKAMTAVKLADEATRSGVDCVPVFWLATEDHDLEEVNHASVLDADGVLQPLVSSARAGVNAPVGTIEFGAEIEPVVEAAAAILGTGDIAELLRASYRPADNYGSAFARLFTTLFSDWGVILLDSLDPELHAIAAPIYGGALERAAEIDDQLLQRGRELEAAGYHQQVRVTPSSTLLFMLRDGARTVIHRKVNGSDTDFLVGEEQIPKAQMLERISRAPDQFSPNVLLRPVVQDYLLPTLTYAGGAAEVAYFAQAAVVYDCLLGHVTPIVPRFSATVIDAKAQRLLSKYELNFVDMLQTPETLRQMLAARALSADLQSAFENAGAAVENSFTAIRSALAKLDPTLVDAADRAGSKIQHQIEHLRASAARAELRHSELLDRHAAFLSTTLFPKRTLQEREIAGISFLARHGLNLLKDLYASIHTDCLDHQVISLSL